MLPIRNWLGRYVLYSIIIQISYLFGWTGVLHLKAEQDLNLHHHTKYIRRIVEISEDHQLDEDEDPSLESGVALRMVVCMSQEGSQRLLQAQYLQSDIGFKRVVGFYEFELAAMDRDANTSIFIQFLVYNLLISLQV
jgi:hypothetical protein